MDHQSFAQLLGNYGEFFGAIAVVLTLGYLAAQIRQNNEFSRFATAKDIFYKFDTLNDRLVSDRELREALLTSDALTEEQQDILYSWANSWANTWIICQSAHDNRLIDDGVFLVCKEDVSVETNRWRNFRPFLIRFLDNFPEFRDYEIFDDLKRERAQENETALSTHP